MKQTHNITVSGDKIAAVNVPVLFFKVEKQDCIFAECPSLGIITSGKNYPDAQKMFEEAFGLWLATVNEDGNIHAVLKELGWTLTKTSVIPSTSVHTQVPVELIAVKSQNILIPVGA